jgi:hypothetical protein
LPLSLIPMKKLFVLFAALFLCVTSHALVRQTRFVFSHNPYSSAIVDGYNDPASQSVLVHNGSAIYGTWLPGCAGPGGVWLGTVATQQQDPVTGIWQTTSIAVLQLDAGCESATWVVTSTGGVTRESPYCPCQH